MVKLNKRIKHLNKQLELVAVKGYYSGVWQVIEKELAKTRHEAKRELKVRKNGRRLSLINGDK